MICTIIHIICYVMLTYICTVIWSVNIHCDLSGDSLGRISALGVDGEV